MTKKIEVGDTIRFWHPSFYAPVLGKVTEADERWASATYKVLIIKFPEGIDDMLLIKLCNEEQEITHKEIIHKMNKYIFCENIGE